MKVARYKFKKSMMFEGQLQAWIDKNAKGFTLNSPAGAWEWGDVRVDIEPQSKGVIKADWNKLPFKDCTFDTIVSDPIWKEKSYFRRMKQFFELTRVCKEGGIIIFNAYWIPESRQVTLREQFIRQSFRFANCSILSIFEKTLGAPMENYAT